MKRSVVNQAYRDAKACFTKHSWVLPPSPRWDILDFGLGDFANKGLVLVNLATEPEYCEKLMYARRHQTTPAHTHARKKEDIISRFGSLELILWGSRPPAGPARYSGPKGSVTVNVDGQPVTLPNGRPIVINAGSRITLTPGVWHEFRPVTEECIIGEVSTANDDANDNFFADLEISRFPSIVDDEPAEVRLLWEH
jgi:D-lyxose ketol-isomerase